MAANTMVSALIDVWEHGTSTLPAERALDLLEAVNDRAAAEFRDMTLGERDAALLMVRRRLFGDELAPVTECVWCGATVEFDLSVTDLLSSGQSTGTCGIDSTRGSCELRPVTTADLLAALAVDAPAREVVARCTGLDPHEVDEAVVGKALERLSDLDPMADLRLEMTCPECDRSWAAGLDVAAFVWAELTDWARATFDDVHTLAATFGWSEFEILSLSPTRRARYVGLARG